MDDPVKQIIKKMWDLYEQKLGHREITNSGNDLIGTQFYLIW